MSNIVIKIILAVLLIASIAPYLVSYIRKHNKAKTIKNNKNHNEDPPVASGAIEAVVSEETPSIMDEESVTDDLPPTEKYNTSKFNITLNRAITAVLFENDASASIVSAAIDGGYHQAVKCLEHMEYMGIIGPLNPPMPRAIFLHPILYRQFIGSKLLSYPPELGVSEVIKLLADEVSSLLNRTFHEIEIVDFMQGSEFENWCAILLEDLGYKDVEVTAKSGDQGVDILARLEDARFAFQCKCYSYDLGNTPVQEVYAGKCFYGCHVGVVITNRRYSSGAVELATATNTVLWNRDKLQDLIERTKDKRTRRNHYKNVV